MARQFREVDLAGRFALNGHSHRIILSALEALLLQRRLVLGAVGRRRQCDVRVLNAGQGHIDVGAGRSERCAERLGDRRDGQPGHVQRIAVLVNEAKLGDGLLIGEHHIIGQY